MQELTQSILRNLFCIYSIPGSSVLIQYIINANLIKLNIIQKLTFLSLSDICILGPL